MSTCTHNVRIRALPVHHTVELEVCGVGATNDPMNWFENSTDAIVSIKFTNELETNDSILFPDALVYQKDNGSVMVQVYHKKSHTGQYLYFMPHHLLNHKRGKNPV